MLVYVSEIKLLRCRYLYNIWYYIDVLLMYCWYAIPCIETCHLFVTEQLGVFKNGLNSTQRRFPKSVGVDKISHMPILLLPSCHFVDLISPCHYVRLCLKNRTSKNGWTWLIIIKQQLEFHQFPLHIPATCVLLISSDWIIRAWDWCPNY